MKEKIYEEIGKNYRFFLNWRHAAFAGYMVVLVATLSLCVSSYKDSRTILWLITLAGAPFGIIFWIIDFRIRQVFQNAIKAGRLLEGEQGGYFSEQAKIGTVPKLDKYPKLLTHTTALWAVYIGSSLILLALSLYFKFIFT